MRILKIACQLRTRGRYLRHRLRHSPLLDRCWPPRRRQYQFQSRNGRRPARRRSPHPRHLRQLPLLLQLQRRRLRRQLHRQLRGSVRVACRRDRPSPRRFSAQQALFARHYQSCKNCCLCSMEISERQSQTFSIRRLRRRLLLQHWHHPHQRALTWGRSRKTSPSCK